MANVMIRQEEGYMTLYIAKKDCEEKIVSLEFESDDRWGGLVSLADGSEFYIDPLPGKPKLPKSLRARRPMAS